MRRMIIKQNNAPEEGILPSYAGQNDDTFQWCESTLLIRNLLFCKSKNIFKDIV